MEDDQDKLPKPPNIVDPVHYVEIGELYAQRVPVAVIARKFNCSETQISNIVVKHVLPRVKMDPANAVELEIVTINLLHRKAEQILACPDAKESAINRAFNAIKWCVEQRCKILGHLAAKEMHHTHEEFRVAGMSPSEVDRKVFEIIMQKVQDRRAYEESMKQQQRLPHEDNGEAPQ